MGAWSYVCTAHPHLVVSICQDRLPPVFLLYGTSLGSFSYSETLLHSSPLPLLPSPSPFSSSSSFLLLLPPHLPLPPFTASLSASCCFHTIIPFYTPSFLSCFFFFLTLCLWDYWLLLCNKLAQNAMPYSRLWPQGWAWCLLLLNDQLRPEQVHWYPQIVRWKRKSTDNHS